MFRELSLYGERSESRVFAVRVVVLENTLSSELGGQELSLFDVCEGLSKKGHQIVLLYVKDGDLLDRYKSFCVEVIRVGGYCFSKSHPILSFFQLLRDIFSIKTTSDTIIYANQYLDSFFAALFSKLKNCPFVCHLRLPPPDVFSRQYAFGLSKANTLIAVSRKTRKDYVERGFKERSIQVIYNGIEVSRFPASENWRESRRGFGLPEKAFVVAYAGRLHPVKGVETLLNAFSKASIGSESRLIISGRAAVLVESDGKNRNYLAELKNYAKSLFIEDRVIWMDYCRNIPELLGMSDVVVLPSLWSEPFGRIVIEALSCGVPVLASHVGGIPEILNGEFASFLFPPGNVEKLTELLNGMKDWRHRDPALGARCREHVSSNFTIQKTTDQIEAVFLHALNNR